MFPCLLVGYEEIGEDPDAKVAQRNMVESSQREFFPFSNGKVPTSYTGSQLGSARGNEYSHHGNSSVCPPTMEHISSARTFKLSHLKVWRARRVGQR